VGGQSCNGKIAMSKQIQYCTCKINLAGQNCHTVIYGVQNPVTWPEVQVLQMLHGDENVMDVMPVGVGEVWPTEEKNRLISIYGHRIVEACFPGRAFRMEYMLTEEVDLPRYDDGKPSTVVAPASNGDDDDDDGEDEVAKAKANLEPIFKPARGRRSPPPPTPSDQ
jgi:hypothetical protein